jgi:hypothetical protein
MIVVSIKMAIRKEAFRPIYPLERSEAEEEIL